MGNALPAVAGTLAAFWRKIGAAGEHCRCPDSQTLGVLTNRSLQFGEDRLHFVRAFCGDSFSTEFSDAILNATGRQNRNHGRASGDKGQKCLYITG
jgi:hypothetical protein